MKKRSTFSGKLGYVLAAAGSAVGLGNIWRFPYLAAKYGGGIFLLIYILLAVSFGYTLMIAETALGRMTKKSPVGAFAQYGHKIGGIITSIIPIIIVPYYCVIGGWVLKYLFEYLNGNGLELAQDGYFSNFISTSNPVIYLLLFALFVIVIVLGGVEKGVESSSKIMMPILVILAFIVMIHSVTRPGALEGVKYFLIPNFDNFSVMTIVAAMGQMFYSLSIAMGILITYGSYLNKDIDIAKTTTQVELFDTAIAIMAGLMIIPAVFAYNGGSAETLQAGPSLMFITLPKVFADTKLCNVIGALFFFLVFFAAATSAISLLETNISTLEDEFHLSRKQSAMVMIVIIALLGSLSALGYGPLSMIKILGMQFLDLFDFISNSIMMPIAAFATCLLIIKVIGIDKIIAEVKSSGVFKREKIFTFTMKYLTIAFTIIILISSILNVLGIINI